MFLLQRVFQFMHADLAVLTEWGLAQVLAKFLTENYHPKFRDGVLQNGPWKHRKVSWAKFFSIDFHYAWIEVTPDEYQFNKAVKKYDLPKLDNRVVFDLYSVQSQQKEC